MNEALIAGLVGLAVAAIEVAKLAISKIKNGKDHNGLNEIGVLTQRQHQWLKDLHEWHNREDSEGVKIWYVRPGLERAITSLSACIERQTVAIEKILGEIHDTRRDVDKISDDIQRITDDIGRLRK
jgi:hypothetical protein